MRSYDEAFAAAKDERAFSNGTEYEIWAARYCYECVKELFGNDETYCPILSVALLGRWPAEWTRRTHEWQIGDASGSYEVVDTCTEFVQRPDDGGGGDDDPEPPTGPGPFDAEQPGQTDIFTFFAEDVIEQSKREQVTAG